MFGEMRNKETIDVPTAEGVIKESLADYITRLKQERDELEQENKELKETKDKYYQQTLDDDILLNNLKEENEGLKIKHQRYRECSMQLNKKYKSALEEIKNMLPEECCNKNQCNYCPHNNADLCTCKIAKKINEVLGNEG